MSGQTIAVVEDEAMIAEAVAARLRAEGFRVEVAATGPEGVELCRRLAPDLVVLDWMLPGFDGIEVCRRIQADRPVPVLFLTSRDAEADVLVGLGIGADDYVTKPFSPRELVARVHVLLRRTARGAATAAPERVQLGPYLLDLEGRRLLRGGCSRLPAIRILRVASRVAVCLRRGECRLASRDRYTCYRMHMPGLTRRTQLLLDDERYAQLEARALAERRSVAAIVREAIDEKLANDSDAGVRRRAAAALLGSPPPAEDREPDWAEVKRTMRDAGGSP